MPASGQHDAHARRAPPAGGYYVNGTADQNLVLRWNGTRWATVSSPDPGTTESNELPGVSCASSRFCMATGYYVNGAGVLILEAMAVGVATASIPGSSGQIDGCYTAKAAANKTHAVCAQSRVSFRKCHLPS